jgi:hypothetical protein
MVNWETPIATYYEVITGDTDIKHLLAPKVTIDDLRQSAIIRKKIEKHFKLNEDAISLFRFSCLCDTYWIGIPAHYHRTLEAMDLAKEKQYGFFEHENWTERIRYFARSIFVIREHQGKDPIGGIFFQFQPVELHVDGRSFLGFSFPIKIGIAFFFSTKEKMHPISWNTIERCRLWENLLNSIDAAIHLAKIKGTTCITPASSQPRHADTEDSIKKIFIESIAPLTRQLVEMRESINASNTSRQPIMQSMPTASPGALVTESLLKRKGQPIDPNIVKRKEIVKQHPEPSANLKDSEMPNVSSQILDKGNSPLFSNLSNLQWNEVKIVLVSDDMIRICARSERGLYHFAAIGFQDARKGDSPTVLWQLLMVLANNDRMIPARNNIKAEHARNLPKHIQRLRKHLKILFGIKDDPFYEYRKVRGYKARFSIQKASGIDRLNEEDVHPKTGNDVEQIRQDEITRVNRHKS